MILLLYFPLQQNCMSLTNEKLLQVLVRPRNGYYVNSSNKIWKASVKPRQGPTFKKRQSCRLQYHRKIRENQGQVLSSYSNDLLRKNSTGFWKCWNSKFENRHKCNEVEGSVDVDVVVNKFADHFSAGHSPNDPSRASSLYDEFIDLRTNYSSFPLPSNNAFDAEL